MAEVLFTCLPMETMGQRSSKGEKCFLMPHPTLSGDPVHGGGPAKGGRRRGSEAASRRQPTPVAKGRTAVGREHLNLIISLNNSTYLFQKGVPTHMAIHPEDHGTRQRRGKIDCDILRQLFNTLDPATHKHPTDDQIGDAMGYSACSIKSVRQKMGLKRRVGHSTLDYTNIDPHLLAGMSPTDASKLTGVSVSCLSARRRQLGLPAMRGGSMGMRPREYDPDHQPTRTINYAEYLEKELRDDYEKHYSKRFVTFDMFKEWLKGYSGRKHMELKLYSDIRLNLPDGCIHAHYQPYFSDNLGHQV